MKVLVIGSGGREHAICSSLKKSTKVSKIYCASGNAGIAQIAECVPIADTEIEKLLDFAKKNGIDLTVVGPEVSLSLGIVDLFEQNGLKIFGASKLATQIESSKEFAKDLMKRHDIPTAKYEIFDNHASAMKHLKQNGVPTVIKYDGLAAGKGVVVATSMQEAILALDDMLLNKKFGQGRVIIEEFLEGVEFSFMCFVSGDKVYPMVLAQDHKRAFENNKGPNTGGMGAYSPLTFITKEDEEYALEHIMKPTAKAMVAENCPFTGVLYGGLMKTSDGIKVIEFNARFGDPETEVVLPRLKSDIFDIFNDILDNKIPLIDWLPQASIGFVLASKGYPEAYKKGIEIKGCSLLEGVELFHMGTKQEGNKLLTNGGRVLFVTALAETITEARQKALQEISKIECENLFYRKDIAYQAIDK